MAVWRQAPNTQAANGQAANNPRCTNGPRYGRSYGTIAPAIVRAASTYVSPWSTICCTQTSWPSHQHYGSCMRGGSSFCLVIALLLHIHLFVIFYILFIYLIFLSFCLKFHCTTYNNYFYYYYYYYTHQDRCTTKTKKRSISMTIHMDQ